MSQISTCGCSTQRSLANSVAIVGKMDSNSKMCSPSSTFASAPNFWEINLYCRWFVVLLHGVQNITEAPILCQFLSTSIMTTILTPSKSHLLIWTMSKWSVEYLKLLFLRTCYTSAKTYCQQIDGGIELFFGHNLLLQQVVNSEDCHIVLENEDFGSKCHLYYQICLHLFSAPLMVI